MFASPFQSRDLQEDESRGGAGEAEADEGGGLGMRQSHAIGDLTAECVIWRLYFRIFYSFATSLL